MIFGVIFCATVHIRTSERAQKVMNIVTDPLGDEQHFQEPHALRNTGTQETCKLTDSLVLVSLVYVASGIPFQTFNSHDMRSVITILPITIRQTDPTCLK